MSKECSALDGDKCRNGFPVNEACHGRGAWMNSKEDAGVYRPAPWAGPVCCNEDLCGRLYPETGKPARATGGGNEP